jgi:hypothetical protein
MAVGNLIRLSLPINVFNNVTNKLINRPASVLTSYTVSGVSGLTLMTRFILPVNAYFIINVAYSLTSALGAGTTPLTFNLNIVQNAISSGGAPKKRKNKSKKKPRSSK